MKIGIIGYGKMGKAIEKVAIDRGHLISFKTNKCDLNFINDVDITIEFSTPESAFTNIKKIKLKEKKFHSLDKNFI